jgi:hypothetical protein
MSDIHPDSLPLKGEEVIRDFCWGADEIGAVINRTGRQAFHLLSNGEIKCARKVGGRWVASRRTLLREFGAASS